MRDEVAWRLLEQQKLEEQRQLEARQREEVIEGLKDQIRQELTQLHEQPPPPLERQTRDEQRGEEFVSVVEQRVRQALEQLAQQQQARLEQPAPPPLAPPLSGAWPEEERVRALISAEVQPLRQETQAAAEAACVVRNLLAFVTAGVVVVLTGWPATCAAAASAAADGEPWWGVATYVIVTWALWWPTCEFFIRPSVWGHWPPVLVTFWRVVVWFREHWVLGSKEERLRRSARQASSAPRPL